MSNPDHAAARLLLAMLQRDYLSFTDAIDPDEPCAHGGGIYRSRMLHERLAIYVHAPHLYVEADLNSWLGLLHHKRRGERLR